MPLDGLPVPHEHQKCFAAGHQRWSRVHDDCAGSGGAEGNREAESGNAAVSHPPNPDGSKKFRLPVEQFAQIARLKRPGDYFRHTKYSRPRSGARSSSSTESNSRRWSTCASEPTAVT